MSPELIGIISVGVAIIAANVGLAVLFVRLFAWLRQDVKEQGDRLDKRITELRKEMTEQGKEIKEHGKEIEEVKIEVASLRATVMDGVGPT